MYIQNPPHREHSHGGADFYSQKTRFLLELIRSRHIRLNLIQIWDGTHRRPQMKLNGEHILRLAYRGLAVWGSSFLRGFSLLQLNQLQQTLRGTLRYTLNRLNHGR